MPKEEEIDEPGDGDEVHGLEAAAGVVILVVACLAVAGYCGFVASTGYYRPDGRVLWAVVGHWSVLTVGFLLLSVVFALRGMKMGPEALCRKVAKWTAIVMGVDLVALYVVKAVLLIMQLWTRQ